MAEDREWIRDLFAAFGPVSVKRLFGGAGIFADGTMFGLVMKDAIYLRTDETTRAAYMTEGSAPFSFDKPSQNKTISTVYYALPARLYDDPDELAQWARKALDLARDKAAQKTSKRRPAKRPRA